MDLPWLRVRPVACAVLAVISTVVHFTLRAKELRTLREIRNRLDASQTNRE